MFTSSSLFKKKNIVLLMQSTAHIISSVAEILTKAFSGMVIEIVSLLRDVVLVFVPNEKRLVKISVSLVCVLIGVIIGILLNIKLNDNIWYGYIPLIATIIYTVFLVLGEIILSKQEILLKIGLIFNAIGWIIYTIFIKLYVATAFNTITVIVSLISIYVLIKKQKTNKKEENEL